MRFKTPFLLGLGPAFFALLIATGALLGSCGKKEQLESFGLKTVELRFEPEDLGQMRSDLFTKIRKPAQVVLAGEEGTADVRYSGQFTLFSPKKSMDLKLSKPLEYKKSRRVRLLGQLTDGTALRNDLGFSIFEDAGFPTPKRELVYFYLNQKPQGLYLLCESLTQDFLRSRKIPFVTLYQGKLAAADFTISTPEELDKHFEPEHDSKNNADLVSFLSELEKADSPTAIRALVERIDVEEFMRYLAVATFLNHRDGQANNFYLYRETTTNRFRIVPWDLDKIWPDLTKVNTPGASPPPPRGYDFYRENALSEKLFRIPEFKEMYRTELARLFEEWPLSRIERWLEKEGARIETAWRADRGYAERGTTHAEERARLLSNIRNWHAKVKPYSQKGQPE